jgi:hypothetical protein
MDVIIYWAKQQPFNKITQMPGIACCYLYTIQVPMFS